MSERTDQLLTDGLNAGYASKTKPLNVDRAGGK